MKNRKGPKDPDSVAAMEIVAMERREGEMKSLQLKKRETAVALVMRAAGKIEAMNFSEAQARFFKLLILKQVKDSKQYRDEFEMTWDQFCTSVGLERRTVDLHLQDLKPFKVEFLETFFQFSGLDFSKIKYLAEAKLEGLAEIRGTSIIYNGEEIPISTERAPDVLALFEQMESDLRKRAEEAEADHRAAKRHLRDKDALIEKKNKELDRIQGKARSKDLTPEEDGFLAQMEQLRIGFDGYMLNVEPQRIDELLSFAAPRDEKTGLHPETNVTPRMRAAYLETINYMRRQIVAAYDTACEMYGHDMEDGKAWTPAKFALVHSTEGKK